MRDRLLPLLLLVYICPNSHCSLTVEPMSGKGIEYRQSLMLSEEEQD